MTDIILQGNKKVNLFRFKDSLIDEVIFEDKDNWYIKCEKLAYIAENRFNEENSISVVSSEFIKLDLTDNGRENMNIIRSYKSRKPTYKQEGVNYSQLVKLQ